MVVFSRFIKDCLTGLDGETFDAWRFSAFFALLSLVTISAYATYRSHVFDAQNFGIGAAAILGGAAWGIRQKKDTEPSAREGGD